MCTLALAVGLSPRYPVVVAANRDELLSRPSAGPRVWTPVSSSTASSAANDDVPFVAPEDLQAGGTWLGVNRFGLFVGITNRYGAPKHEDRVSRGQLVVDALRKYTSCEELHRALRGLPDDAHNAFHLVYADVHGGAGLTWSDGERVQQRILRPGLHVFSERSLGAAEDRRSESVRARFPRRLALGREGQGAPADLVALLRHHDEADPLAATCVHVPSFEYGTRSSAVLMLGADAAEDRLYWAEGAPCTAPFADLSATLRLLVRPALPR